MKKTLAYVLIIIMVWSTLTTAAFSESEIFEFTPQMTSQADYSALTWFSNSANRAAVALLLYNDYVNAAGIEASSEIFYSQSSYVAKY